MAEYERNVVVDYDQIIFSGHAIRQMFNREITKNDVVESINNGRIISEQRDKKMKCVICKQGQTNNGFTTVTLERGRTTVVIKEVPAEVCENCGEYYLSDVVTEKVQNLAEQAFQHGVEIEVLKYAA